ncbi:Uncharacterized protein YP598_0369 [Yersinia pseudotuberculosis]|uniref:Uncharacterized protein n=1 Tax=Yersinia pseudotuberculosis serotype O:1b (strain IP 31758) TaxID=349747 RepID=A0A0U1R1W0_YERP3|nr:hypothetical protein YpsIP31758_0363 [Yersinia pseudotuberculosis IP 31758]UFA59997.1 Uncharacterized protein YP598_0369 [Yersinia pseudotuberculosis]
MASIKSWLYLFCFKMVNFLVVCPIYLIVFILKSILLTNF